MWLMFAHFEPAGLEPAILIVDHVGEPQYVASSVEDAIDWLGAAGQPEVGIPIAGGTEIYRIEPAGPPRLARRAPALRRTLPPVGGGNGQPTGGASPTPHPAPAGNRHARRRACAIARGQAGRPPRAVY